VMCQPVIAYGPVIALNIGVVLRLARRDERDLDAVFCCPSLGRRSDVFRTIVAPDHEQLAASFDQLVQRPDHAFRW